MSLHASYVMEREGNILIEEPWGFIEYDLKPPFARIHSLYVRPDYRRSGKGSELADRVTLQATLCGCTTLYAQVWTGALNATDSLRAILAYGFRVQGVSGDCIIMTKSIGG